MTESDKMKVLDLFSGTGSATQAFVDKGHEVVRVEWNKGLTSSYSDERCRTITADVRDLDLDIRDYLRDWRPDLIWASPPCEGFSIAAIGKHWEKDGGGPGIHTPKHETAEKGLELLVATYSIVQKIGPRWFFIENPRGMMRKVIERRWPGLHESRVTVSYCQYGDFRMKPTDLWGRFPRTWVPRPICRPGATCHVAAPRGSRTGTQGPMSYAEKSMVPYELGESIEQACMVQQRNL